MPTAPLIDVSYFPGCSLATTAKENNQSLVESCRRMGINLVEIPDWNCCGSSSAHSINHRLSFELAARNLSLAPSGRPLVAACPSCLLKLKQAQLTLKKDPAAREEFYRRWGRPFDPELSIQHFFELLENFDLRAYLSQNSFRRIDLTFAPYYGCMLHHPPQLRLKSSYYGIMEETLSALGMQARRWAYMSRCCGTFLSVARPDIVTPKVNAIVEGATQAGAECIVTACAMCHLNLEVRCTLKSAAPIFHFSEIVSLALGTSNHKNWFSRHLIDPRPLLKSKNLY